MENLHLINTKKFKTITVEFRFAKEFDSFSKARLILLSRLLCIYSEKYPDKVSMTKVRDLLYGIKAGSKVRFNNSLGLMFIRFQFVNPKFLTDVKMNDYIAFIDECLKHLFISETLFEEARNNLISDIKRSLEKPRNQELERIHDLISEDIKEFSNYKKDIISDLEKVTIDELKKVYADLFTDYKKDIFVVGEYDDELVDYLSTYLLSNKECKEKDTIYDLKVREDIIEDTIADQSYLSIVYQSPYTRSHEDYFAFVLTNMLFGGSPLSLLFQEVREKRSLCYFIDTIPNRNLGLVRVTTGIDKDKFDEARQEIDRQLKRLRDGDFDQALIDSSKRLMLNNIDSISDDLDDYIDFLYNNLLSYYPFDIDEYKEKIMAVSKEDIQRVASNYKPYLCHFLRGINNEETL